MITSPLTGGTTTHVKSIQTKTIIELYKRNSAVERFFTGLEAIDLYRCNDTGYQFYVPFTVAGDGPFYEDLSRERLYYIPWKNEHEVADGYIKPYDRVLEQGCATGGFLLEEKKRKQIISFGTELNDAARTEAEAAGISFTPIADADVVCSFQVLEHIADVRSFINEAITATKPSGTIIFAVPNNDTFMKDDPTGFLNMPPHHMGIWNRAVFEAFPKYFPLDLVAIHTECLQPHLYRYYYQRVFGDLIRPYGFFGKVVNKILFESVAKHIIKRKAHAITGHTLIGVFTKRV